MNKYDDTDFQIEREESIEYEENINKISERFNNGTETIEDIIKYCRNYEITFENRLTLRVVEKKYFDKLVQRIKKLEEENKTLKNFTSAIFNGNIEKEFIPVEKVKNIKKELKIMSNERYIKFLKSNRLNKKLHDEGIQLDAKIQLCDELLEDK